MAVFLDFKRAFETIDRDIIIEKLYMYGIQGVELQWFKSYLEGRKQITKINGEKSTASENVYGVPQGSILGALLFIIYINDLPNIIEKCNIMLYADDTLLYSVGKTDEECRQNMSDDINKICNWLNMNKLKLNESKTKLMEINMSTNRIFKINDKIIEKVDCIKYLGFMIDKQLKFKQHIDYVCQKIGKKIGFFQRIRKSISILTAITVYNTMIKPHFEYGSTILYTCCLDTHMERMQKLQNRAMRIILRCSRYTSIGAMLSTLQWMTVGQRLELNTLCFIRKLRLNDAPEYLCEQAAYVGDVQPYQLRNAQNFRIQRATSTAVQRALFQKGFRKFNRLPDSLKVERNINIFKRECVKLIRSNW